MSSSRGAVPFGKEIIHYSYCHADRKTLEIAVHPDQTVAVKAPLGTAVEEIRRRVSRRAAWIARQGDFFRRFEPLTPPRCYVRGETHLYLGRRYRLRVAGGDQDAVGLTRGFFRVELRGDRSREKIKVLMERWYRDKAAERFQESLDRCWPLFKKFGPTKPRLQIRKMQRRWGSLSANGRLTLNVDLIRAPRECIDYVIVHELSHLRHNSHSSKFYRFLDKTMPDWEGRKRRLEITLA